MTKREEIKVWRDFVAGLPAGYLRISEGIKALRLDAEKIARSACSYASYASDILKQRRPA